jgi:hypothetical protein
MNRVGDTLICTGSNEEIIKAFATHRVDFILIGGLAVAWYCSDRQADDMDLLVNPTPDNSARVAQALATLPLLNSGCFDSKSFTRPGLQVPLKSHYYAELLTPRKEGPNYSEIAKEAVDAKLFQRPVRLASPASLIRMKQQAVASAEKERDKHLKDIERLSKHVI